MTPLAHAIAKQIVTPKKRRKPIYLPDVKSYALPSDLMADIHCFECSEVVELAYELADSGKVPEVMEDGAFLPAPRTWIEHKEPDGKKVGWLLTEDPLEFKVVMELDHVFCVHNVDLTCENEESHAMTGLLLAMLALINTPRIIGRQSFMPHRGLERDLTRHFAVGRFPLHAWTELRLNVAKPIEIDDGEPHEAHLTGRRALHFCRAHLRVRLGQIEFVTSHWRGDAAIGIKQTKYKVAR